MNFFYNLGGWNNNFKMTFPFSKLLLTSVTGRDNTGIHSKSIAHIHVMFDPSLEPPCQGGSKEEHV